MQHIDLTDYVVSRSGGWFGIKEYYTPGMLTLVEPTDSVTLAGPLRVRVAIQAQNSFDVIGTPILSTQAKELFGYVLDIPPGHTWTYPRLPFVIRDPVLGAAPSAPAASLSAAGVAVAAPPQPAAAAQPVTSAAASIDPTSTALFRRLVPGVNDRLIVVIRPAGPDACLDPCAPLADPRKPTAKDCHCGCKPCHCHTPGDDISCDVAVANIPDMGVFFPTACEPCAPGASIGMPALKGPTLIVPPARGGTVRTRYFNGMFMTSEDLETDQRNVRLKRALMNRALGQGVVWGLNVALDGDAICVLPGYGVDCCGNDLVITTPYRVDAQALLRDPAAAALLATRKPQRFSLVLEYFECPEQPRPVHGDPCAPEATRCETSRIRESARLRLVAPCEVDDSGPFKDFLVEIEKLKSDRVVGQILAQPLPAQPGVALDHVPFKMRVETRRGTTSPPARTRTLTPKPGTNGVEDRDRGDIHVIEEDSFRVTLEAEPGFKFLEARLAKVKTLQGSPATAVPVDTAFPSLEPLPTPGTPTTKIAWGEGFGNQSLPLGQQASTAEPIPAAFAYQVRGWRMREDASGNELTAAQTEVHVTPLTPRDWQATPRGTLNPDGISLADPDGVLRGSVLHIQVLPTDVRAVVQPPQVPCFTEACDPEKLRFPVPPPWLHADPTTPGQAADPRVLVLALLHSWLAIEMARSKVGTSRPVETARLQVAVGIYHAAWKLFFATVPDTQRFQLTDALQRLLRAWCCALLYPGPTCHCEPHGVVIGCAFASGGQIQSVDPWGGRRWVVHYPLLAYWGQQFGIMPIDALASKVFGLICCIAGLPAPRLPVGRTDTVGLAPGLSTGSGRPSVGRASEVDLGRALLIVDGPAEAAARIAELGLPVRRQVSVNPFDFVLRFTEAMRVDADPNAQRPLIHFTVLGLPEFHLVAPGDPEPAPPPPVPERGRLRDLVGTTIARRSGRAAVPALLRSFAEDLSLKVINAMPIEPRGAAETAVARRLAAAGVTTLGALLERSPEELHVEILNREHADRLTALVDRTEADAAAAAKAVSAALAEVAAEKRVFARDAFGAPAAALELSTRLGKTPKLKTGLPNLRDLIVETAGGG